MQVILLEHIDRLGDMGDEVTVKPGFARNFLLPQRKALRATAANRELFESRRAELEELNRKRRDEALGIAGGMHGTALVLVRQAGETGQLYGSVSARDIAQTLAEAGFKVERGQIQLDRPIKELGIYPVRIVLHPEVTETVSVNVARSEEEAQSQAERLARGEEVVRHPGEDEIDEEAEEILERAEEAMAAAGIEPEPEDGEEAATESVEEEQGDGETESGDGEEEAKTA